MYQPGLDSAIGCCGCDGRPLAIAHGGIHIPNGGILWNIGACSELDYRALKGSDPYLKDMFDANSTDPNLIKDMFDGNSTDPGRTPKRRSTGPHAARRWLRWLRIGPSPASAKVSSPWREWAGLVFLRPPPGDRLAMNIKRGGFSLPMLAVAVIRGLRDDTRHHEVSFAIRGKKTSFTEAIDLIKAAYRSVGDSDPFGVGENRSRFTSAVAN